MEYNFREIEKKWHDYWIAEKVYKVEKDTNKPKYYVLDMFPYPSGAGLHVGHPLGYIASDIYSRFKRLQGFNVLHPMGYDAYGLPAEQYAIQTGQHPEITTKNNIARYREQLEKIGFCYDWSREIRTCDPEYYKWTQWSFIRMFNSYYCNDEKQARPISELIQAFETSGTEGLNVACGEELSFTAEEWKAKSDKEKQEILLNYRIAYRGETMVNWCAALGTVLANDEVVNGVSERGGYPVEQKIMRQWCLRVSAYAQRLLDGLDTIDWTDSLKETQKNWIGRSEGAEVRFKVKDSDREFTIFTTRADTMFGVTFMVLAPESELVQQLTTADQKAEVDAYLDRTKKRTERERIADRQVTGVFSGSYAINPFTGEAVPIWISDYVLAGYGTGAIMAVPAHDSRDYAFAKHFGLEIRPLVEGCDVSEESFDAKEGIVCNSPRDGVTPYCDLSLNGLTIKEAIAATKKYVKDHDLGRVKINYRLRDAIFSRQRYWGEPFPVYYDADGMPQMLPEECLPLLLPEVDKFLPTETGEPPLGHAVKWAWDTVNQKVTEVSKIDNPTIFPEEDKIISGGNFHGQPLAISYDFLAIALAELGNISERRVAQLIMGLRGLPEFLVANPGLNSGFMIPQYAAASMVSQNKMYCYAASSDSIVSSNGQEDHVSMGANAATKLFKIMDNLDHILAIELMNAAQGIEFRRPARTSPVLEKFLKDYRKEVPFIDEDIIMYTEIHRTVAFIRRKDFVY